MHLDPGVCGATSTYSVHEQETVAHGVMVGASSFCPCDPSRASPWDIFPLCAPSRCGMKSKEHQKKRDWSDRRDGPIKRRPQDKCVWTSAGEQALWDERWRSRLDKIGAGGDGVRRRAPKGLQRDGRRISQYSRTTGRIPQSRSQTLLSIS